MTTSAGKSTIRVHQICFRGIMGTSDTNIRLGDRSHRECCKNFEVTTKPSAHTSHECESHLDQMAYTRRLDAKKPTRQAAWREGPLTASSLASLQQGGGGWAIYPHSPKSIVTTLETLVEKRVEAENLTRRNRAVSDLQYARQAHLRTRYTALSLSGPA